MFQKTLKVGDIITIKQHKNAKQHLIVVSSGRNISEDSTRNESYWVDQIECVEILDFRKVSSGNQWPIAYTDKKNYKFYLDTGCMSGEGKKIGVDDIKVQGTVALEIRTVTTYTTKNKIKYY